MAEGTTYAIPTPGYPRAQYVAIQYPSGRNVHYGKPDLWYVDLGFPRLIAACGYVPHWHNGAREVDKKISCRRCLAGPASWRHPRH